MTDLSTFPIETWEPERILPYEFNHKKHPEKQIATLAKLIREKGLINPILLEEDGTIIAGHGRFLAIQRLGWAKVPVRVAYGVSKQDAAALRIADNKTVSNDYDTDILSDELMRLGDDYDLGMLGFDARELSILISDAGEIDADSLVGDIDMAVEAHEAEIENSSEKADGDVVRLDKAFGFKTISLPSQKTVTRFMAEIEASTGKTGADALIEFMSAHLKAA